MAFSHLSWLSPARHYWSATVLYRPATYNHAEYRVVFCTGAAAVAAPALRGQSGHVLSLSCEHPVFHSRERIRSNAVLLLPRLLHSPCGITALYVRKLREFNAAHNVEEP